MRKENNVNIVRKAGLLDRFHITRHYLLYDSCVTATAKYSFLDHHLDETILFPALRRVVEAHAALGVRLVGDSTNHPAFQRLQLVDLTKAVNYSDQDGNALQQVLENHLMHSFDTNAGLPLWRLTVLVDNTVVFSWHHCIGDGMSGLAFHRALLAALNADNTTYKGVESVDIRPTISLTPAIESLVRVRPSILQFCHSIFDLFSPVSWTLGGSAWTGNPVKQSSLRTEVRLLEFSPEDTTKFVTCCRKHKATLTPALHTLAVSVLSQLLHAQTDPLKPWKSISTSIPMSLRPVTHTSPDVICNHVSRYHSYPTLSSRFSWATASTLSSTLSTFRTKAVGEVGMLKFLFGQYETFFRDKVGKKREAGLEISSIGRFDPSGTAQADLDKWHIDRMIFAQSDVVTGAAIKMNVCGNPFGGLAVTVTWGSEAVENSFAEVFVSKFKQMFQEVLEESYNNGFRGTDNK